MHSRFLTALLATAFICQGLNAQQARPPLPPDVVVQAQEIQQLMQTQKYAEAMDKLDALEARHPDRPELINIRGSLYMTSALRDLAKAGECFDQALKLSPGEFPLLFNKAEILFVSHDWPAAALASQKLLDDTPKLPLVYRHMVLFKKLVCEVKQDHLPEAEKILNTHFTFMDDTPAFYFSKAAIAFQKKDIPTAEDWIKRANGIFKPAETGTYTDSLTEARWIANISLPAAEKKASN
jgi:predicted Zn-dependent protease